MSLRTFSVMLTVFFALALLLQGGCSNNPGKSGGDAKDKNEAAKPDKKENTPEAKPDKKESPSDKEVKPDFILTADDLIKEFDASGEAASKKYKDKVTEVTGRVYTLEPRPIYKDVAITLKGDKEKGFLVFAMMPDQT